MAKWPPKKNVAFNLYVVIRDADGDPVTTGTLSSTISKDGGAGAAGATPTFITTGEGMVKLALTNTQMNADEVAILVKSDAAGAKHAFVVLYTDTQQIGDIPTAAAIADAVWDELLSGHLTAGSFGERLQIIRNGTAQAGAAATITLDASANATDNFYNGMVIFLIGGTGTLQVRIITGYVGASKIATVGRNWITNPDATTVFLILPADVVDDTTLVNRFYDELTSEGRTAGSYGQLLKDNLNAPIATVDTVVDAIKAVTDLLPDAGALNDLATILADTNELQLDDIPGLIAALNDIAAADVLTQVNAALDTAIPELAQGVPAITPTLRTAVMLVYMALRNQLDIIAAFLKIHNDAGTVITKKALSDDGVTYSEAKAATGP